MLDCLFRHDLPWRRMLNGKIMTKKTLIVLFGLLYFSLPVWAQINLLHEFSGGTSASLEGGPWGSLLISGSTLYGMTHGDGMTHGVVKNYGTIFKIQIDGNGYTVLHTFTGKAGDGENPTGDLIISGSTLYGVTSRGGDGDDGTVFKIQTDGSDYGILHSFAGNYGDGTWPHGHLVLSGSTLFGTTPYGGYYGWGTIFKLQTDGSGYMVLHDFQYRYSKGYNPYGSLLLSGSTLYGMTFFGGGLPGEGTVFKIQTDGSEYTLLHVFGGGDDGANPQGSLILSGSTLYGMTEYGGSVVDSNLNKGTIFMLQTDGSNYTLLHGFNGEKNDGGSPMGSLILSEKTLYGMTVKGGNKNLGTIFKIQADGSDFTLRHEFAGGADDGQWPSGSLIVSGTTLFGMAGNGGDDNRGVIFSLPLSTEIIAVTAERFCDKAFIIQYQFGVIEFTVENPDMQACKFRIVRSQDGDDFMLLDEIDASELQNNRFRMEDKNLEKNSIYTYRVAAYNSSGQIIAISKEKTI